MTCLRQIRASAGSGKTFNLTRCFLELLKDGNPAAYPAAPTRAPSLEGNARSPNEIIAVTFTNAAASEMRERIIRQLKTTALGLDAASPLDRKTSMHWLHYVLRDLNALNVRTIDSLLHLIVRAAALELGLRPDYQPVFDTQEALLPALEAFLEQGRKGDAETIDMLRAAFEGLVNYGSSKGFLAGDKLKHNLAPLLEGVLLHQFDNLSGEDELKAKHEILCRDVRNTAQKLLAAAEELPWHKNAKIMAEKLAEGLLEVIDSSAYAKKKDAASLFRNNTALSDNVLGAFSEFSKAVARYTAEGGALLPLALKNAPLVRLCQKLVKLFQDSPDAELFLPNVLVPRMAHQILTGAYGVPEALFRLGTRLTHYLIDEFQDTSEEQWQALRPLIVEALSQGGSLTWVGDVKQSIFGWRGGNSRLFDGILEDKTLGRICPGAPVRDTLDSNWRSRRVIVELNNRLFAPLSDTETAARVLKKLLSSTPEKYIHDAAGLLSKAFAAPTQKIPKDRDNDGGFVTLENVPAEELLTRLSEVIRKIGERRDWADILVLVRKGDDARMTAEQLVADGVPVITENSLLLARHPLVVQTVAFLHFLNNPDDDISFWTLVTGSVLSASLAQAGIDAPSLQDWCAQEAGREALFSRFLGKWPDFCAAVLQPFRNHAGLMTPYDLTSEWFALMGMESRFPDALPFLRRFLEVLHSAETKGISTLAHFLEHWEARNGEEKVPMPEGMNAVSVMTIHKAKGLEAPVVILPWKNSEIRATDRTLVRELGGLRMALPLRRILEEEYYADLTQVACESVNLMYVAFTRARDELRILRPDNRKKGNSKGENVLDILWDEAGLTQPYECGFPCSATRIADNGALPSSSPFVMPASRKKERPMQWLPNLKIFHEFSEDHDSDAKQRGNLLHFCLEHLYITGDPENDADTALQFGMSRHPAISPENRAWLSSQRKGLVWFASQPEARLWLLEGLREQSIINDAGDVLRMDLLARDGEDLLVIDYKSGKPDAAHLPQIRQYLRVLRQSCPATPGVAGLLAYVEQCAFLLVLEDCQSPLCRTYRECRNAMRRQ